MLFFKLLVKRTLKLKYIALRYQLMFWHSVQAVLPLAETHSLDYVADFWVVSEISAIHKQVVYDSATLFSFFQYCNPNAFFLKIKEMTVDFEMFPRMIRSILILEKEIARVKFGFTYEKNQKKIRTKERDANVAYGNQFIPLTFRKHKTKKMKNWVKWKKRKAARLFRKKQTMPSKILFNRLVMNFSQKKTSYPRKKI